MLIKKIHATVNTFESSVNAWLSQKNYAHVYNIDYFIYPNNTVIAVIRYEELKSSIREICK